MKAVLVVVAAIAVAVVVVVEAGGDASTTTTEEKVSTIMSAVEDHCSARRKRQVGPSSEDKVRRLILNVVRECLEGDKPTTPPLPPTTTTTSTTSTTTTSTTTTPTYETTEGPSVPDGPCNSPNTVNLTGEWRLDNKGSDIQPIDGNYNCDAPLFDNTTWFRITGDGGNMIRNTCSPAYSCGSHGGIWTNATMPTVIGQEVWLPLYGSWAGNCYWYPWQVDFPLAVIRCSSSVDFVYKIDGLTGCYHSVCGMWA